MTGLEVELRQDGPIPLAADFRCAPGQLLALVGPSGSGKSTLLRAVAGLYRPRHGRIRVAGETWLDTSAGRALPVHRRRVGLVFQDYALFPHHTALDNVATALGHLPRRQRAGRAAELLAQVRLAGLEDRYPGQLSGGQQQRVAVARALAREPRVLLLDEPFSAVDKATRERLYRELVAIRRQLSIPVVLVTHDLDEALLLADSLCLLHHGRTLQQGLPLEVVRRPVSVEAARLVGQRNLFRARVIAVAGGGALLDWHGHRLQAARAGAARPGQAVAWLIPAAKVVLHRRDRPSRGEAENPVGGVLTECLTLGETTRCLLQVDEDPGRTIDFSVPIHVADRNRLTVGAPVRVSLLAEAIHLMPDEP